MPKQCLLKILSLLPVFLGTFSLTSCSFLAELPLQDYYTRNYDEVAKLSAVDLSSDLTEIDPVLVDTQTDLADEEIEVQSNNLLTANTADAPQIADEEIDEVAISNKQEDKQVLKQASKQAPSETLSDNNIDSSVVLNDLNSKIKESEETELSAINTDNKATSNNKINIASIEDYSASPFLEKSTAEENLFNSILRSFQARDANKFFFFSNEFLISYPNSNLAARVTFMQNEFYFSARFNSSLLAYSIIEIGEINFRSWDELLSKLIQLSYLNVDGIMFEAFQNFGSNKVPFENSENKAGALFNSATIPTVGDFLSKLVSIVRQAQLNLYVKVPVRNHDWLKLAHSQLMDQSWDIEQGRGYYNLKFNPLHPEAEVYFLNLLDEISRYDIDGIVLADDYKLSPLDGVSTLNAILFENDTKNSFSFSRIPDELVKGSIKNYSNTNFSSDFVKFNSWRSSKVHQFLLNVISQARTRYPLIRVGIELSDEMVNEPQYSLYNNITNFFQIVTLPADFFILKKTASKNLNQDKVYYQRAAENILGYLRNNKYLILQDQYSTKYDTIYSFENRLLDFKNSFTASEIPNYLIGPISDSNIWFVLLDQIKIGFPAK